MRPSFICLFIPYLLYMVTGEILWNNDFAWNMYRNISADKVCFVYIYIYMMMMMMMMMMIFLFKY